MNYKEGVGEGVVGSCGEGQGKIQKGKPWRDMVAKGKHFEI